MFPSPSGVSHFSIENNNVIKVFEPSVSVPFRGISFLNITLRLISRKGCKFPSPSGVSHFSIKAFRLSSFARHSGFRPLPGYLISQFKQLFQYHQLRDCFRPLPGYLISQFNVMGLQDLSIKFPSPSGVSHFSIYFVKPLRISIICFRPLPGYLISQSAMLF